MKLKNVLIFLVGVVTGAGGMYFAFKPINDKKVEELVTKEMNKGKNPQGDDIPTEEPEVKSEETQKATETRDLTNYTKALERTDYTKAVVKDKVTTMTGSIEEKIEANPAKKPKKTKVPKKVTQDEFDSTNPAERMTLYYYADDILADDEDVKYDPVETMGATNLKNFKSTYDTVYIFNYATNLMYEIEYSNSRYSDIVGGDYRG